MRILAIETSGNQTAVCFFRQGLVIDLLQHQGQEGGAILIKQLRHIQDNWPEDFANINYIAVTVGPAPYTGLRMGLAAVQGLGLALSRPIWGINTLKLVAWQAAQKNETRKDILVVLDSKRPEIFAQLFDDDAYPLTPEILVKPELLPTIIRQQSTIIVGNAITQLWHQLVRDYEVKNSIPDVSMLAKLALHQIQNQESCLPAIPIYLKSADVSVAKKQFWLINDRNPASRY